MVAQEKKIKFEKDTVMEQRASVRDNDQKMFDKALKHTEQCYGNITGEIPDKESQEWKWYLLTTYDANLRLMLMAEKKRKEQEDGKAK